jgi:hypothetical protein
MDRFRCILSAPAPPCSQHRTRRIQIELSATGDTYFRADYLRDDAHWQRVVGGYLQGVMPQQFPERLQAHREVVLSVRT